MKVPILCWRCSWDAKLPRRKISRTRTENQISVRLSQEARLGVKWIVYPSLRITANSTGRSYSEMRKYLT